MVDDSNLIEDHRELDVKLEKLRDIISKGEIDTVLFAQISKSLKRHIYIEEEEIFPSISKRSNELRQRIAGLEMEHASIWMLLDRVEKEISVRNVEKSPKYIEEISSILVSHNEQEEDKVYPIISQNEKIHKKKLLNMKFLRGGYATGSGGRISDV